MTRRSIVSPSALDPGVVNLKVTNNGIDFADEAVDFEYVNLPSISKIQPERGPIGVPIQVTIHGSGFIEGSTWCRVEDSAATEAIVKAENLLICDIVIKNSGLKEISVSTNLQNYNARSVEIEGVAAPRILRISNHVYL